LAVSYAVPAGSREVTIAFNFLSERTVLLQHLHGKTKDNHENLMTGGLLFYLFDLYTIIMKPYEHYVTDLFLHFAVKTNCVNLWLGISTGRHSNKDREVLYNEKS
jgi:hypothetical protein